MFFRATVFATSSFQRPLTRSMFCIQTSETEFEFPGVSTSLVCCHLLEEWAVTNFVVSIRHRTIGVAHIILLLNIRCESSFLLVTAETDLLLDRKLHLQIILNFSDILHPSAKTRIVLEPGSYL